ncbi:hypothetical protein BGZ61DRAFT_347100 [Ilyonectria robusta]|uniref:uncharacterized protein n=1 Tax=Ilyonectria robusta TaxID=1079257 RepID=UPI001E8E9D3F|nr:uncharacterized protein BGZ61DRAFT_347100 [Ilyonectria robusta]KAH8721679.1 hypothetical protein BGZ61DRAFT_347100 [Ilyonectria robusta]
MALDYLEIILLSIILLATTTYFRKRKASPADTKFLANGHTSVGGGEEGKTRNIKDTLDQSGKNCIIFYGSQTGTAEDYASKLAKEGKSRFGLETMIADLDEYDFDTLDTIPENNIVMFVLASYGEGEPTDNAVRFYDFITGDDVAFSESKTPPLQNIAYVAFGLGNNTYEHYNAVVRNVDKALERLGASRIGEAGEGDDGAGTTEEDFLAWKEPMWSALTMKMGLTEREVVFESLFKIRERTELTPQSSEVYLGELTKSQLENTAQGPFDVHNPFVAPIAASRELFCVEDRNCLHIEVDLDKSGLTYQTGDHIAIWPMNPSGEVDRCLDILGLTEKRNTVIGVDSLDPTTRVFFPTPTTYDTIVRYHLGICGPVSRQFVSNLAVFSPDERTKAEMKKLSSDKEYFHKQTDGHFYTISKLLDMVSNGEKWTNIPFSAWIEGLTKLQPRYYSISSSSLVQPTVASITTVVEKKAIDCQENTFYGVATNYLLSLNQRQNSTPSAEALGPTYQITGPRNKYEGIRVPVHIRHSNFKLPSDPSSPIIMVGPGTGVAPFRAFLQERAKQAEEGVQVGKAILFFGCRRSTEDFIYQPDFESYAKRLGDRFELVTAFSRESLEKFYVQDRLKERGVKLNALLQQGAYFYVCGDAANMAKQVHDVLVQLIEDHRGLSREGAEEIVKNMRSSSQYQEDVWS